MMVAVDPVPRGNEAGSGKADVHQWLAQPAGMQAQVVVYALQQQRTEDRGQQPEGNEAAQAGAVQAAVPRTAGKGVTAVEGVTKDGTAEAAGHRGQADLQPEVAAADHHGGIYQPLQGTDAGIGQQLAG